MNFKSFLIIISISCIIFLPSVVTASPDFVNGGFETGDLTGWDNISGSYGGLAGLVEVTPDAARSGNYGLRLKSDVIKLEGESSEFDYTTVVQTIDESEFEKVDFYYKVNDLSGSGDPYADVIVIIRAGGDGDGAIRGYVIWNTQIEGGWIHVSKTRSEITEQNDLTDDVWSVEPLDIILSTETSSDTDGTVSSDVFFDDVSINDGLGPTPTPTPTIVPTTAGMPVMTYSNTAITVDIVNSTYMKGWLYYLQISNKTSIWDFPVIGFASSIMGPFSDAFVGLGAGNLIYLILWGLFIMMVWRQSGKITIPSMIAVITAGAWSLLIPESSQPWCMILLAAAIASQLLTFFAKE